MQITQKLAKKARDNWNEEGVTIAFLGDSVTQGCFELYHVASGIDVRFDKSSTYHSYVARILDILYPTVPINIINAGVSGGKAEHGLERLERDVLSHRPDLTVVCFGLNDNKRGKEGLELYKESMEQIFIQLEEAQSEIIFMTPNMMATKVSNSLISDELRDMSAIICKCQNEGFLDMYLDAAKDICKRRGIPVCDCYEKWKLLMHNGVDVTELLSNKMNHPTREMNWLFAVSLVETMMEE
jgi:lysophospholipase L1-like esterase